MSRLAPDWLAMRAARLPDEPAIRTLSVAWSRAQLLEASDGLAAALAGADAEPQGCVASLLSDGAPAVVLINAARRLGMVLVPLNRRAAAAELRQQLDAAEVEMLIYDGANAELAAECATPSVALHRVETLMAGSPCAARPFLHDEVDLDAPAVIVFTSGTTGRPKGAVLTNGNLAASAHAWAEVLRPRPTDRWLACLPLFHVAGLAIVTRSARWGVELQVTEGFDADEVSAALDDGVSHLSLVPLQLEEVLAVRRGRAAPESLRAILLGGGPIPPALLERARDAGYPVLTTYGMTETASGIAVGGADADTLANPTAGRSLPRAEVRIDDPDAADGSGEILVRGPMVFAGYVNAPDATLERLRDGWFRTGDIGSIDSDGLLRITDRRDDLFISGGENVYPAEVEAALLAHPAVADVVVFAQPDARWGSVPVAAVVLLDDAATADCELDRHCREHLAAYKVPQRYIRVVELPRDSLGKISRSDLRARLGTAR
jgi:O-succinylbenzoic acid--CoA ligase